MTLLVVIAVVVAWLSVAVLRTLVGDEVKGWLPIVTRAIACAGARRVGGNQRERYEEEWLAILNDYGERRLTAVVRACVFWWGARAIRSASSVRGAPGLEEPAAVEVTADRLGDS